MDKPIILGMERTEPAQPMELRREALRILALADPAAKIGALREPAMPAKALAVDAASVLVPASPLPGRPLKPRLVDPAQVPRRTPFTPEGRAALLHAVAHIEFNAINLALDAVWRFPGLPEPYYRQWWQVACEEALHHGLLAQYLNELGHTYGDFDAHDGLWSMCEKTAADVTARMALVPRTLEARGLDATPPMRAKFAKAGETRAVQILDIILRDEVGHVAVGNRWYRWLCEREGLDPVAHYARLAAQHGAPRLKPPFNLAARRAAGFTDEELRVLEGDREPVVSRTPG
jgi:uncharacterized ferritin-like protein (DUF455 family)